MVAIVLRETVAGQFRFAGASEVLFDGYWVNRLAESLHHKTSLSTGGPLFREVPPPVPQYTSSCSLLRAIARIRGMDDSIENETPPAPKPVSKSRTQVTLAVASLFIITAIAYALLKKSPESSPVVAKKEPSPIERFDLLIAKIKKEREKTLVVTDYEVSDAMIPKIADFTELETVIFDKGTLTDRSMSVLAALPNLQHIRLRLSRITDEGLKELAKCRSLWYINLPHSNCTSKGIAELAAIPQLRQLRIASPQLGNSVAKELAKLKTLRGIHLIDVPITNEGLEQIVSLPILESLYLDNSEVDEKGWRWLYSEHPELHVHVDQAHLDYDPKAHPHHD